MVTENSELITYGSGSDKVVFRGSRLTPGTFQQSYSGFRTGPGADRTALTDLTKVKFSDFSGGIDPTPGIKSWLRDLNKFRYNEGWQTRLPGLMILPFDLVNQTSISSNESIASAVAAGWRAHVVTTSIGDTEARIYIGIGHKVYRNVGNGNSALEVCYTTTDLITSMAVLNVNGTPRVCVATYHASSPTDDVFYVADPTGTWSGNLTTLVALNNSGGDWITAMQYIPTLGAGVNIMVGTIAGSAGVWWQNITTAAAWTMRAVVLASSRNQPGNLPTVTLSNCSPQSHGNEGIGTTPFPSDDGIWKSTENILASDDNDATWDGSAVSGGWSGQTSYLVAGQFADIEDIPSAVELVGCEVSIEGSSTGLSSSNQHLAEVQLRLGTTSVGISKSGGSFGSSDATQVLGGSSDVWGILGGNDFRNLAVAMRAAVGNGGSGNGAGIRIDHIFISSFVYRELGSLVSFPLGGWMVTANPSYPERIAIVVPATKNDIGAITEPRVLWYLDFEWDTGQERPVLNYTRPNTGLNYIHHAVPFQGGYAVCGNNSAGAGISLKHVDSSGNLRDFGFPAHNGKEEMRINSLYPQGSWLVLDCVTTDFGDRQWWFYNNGRFFPDTILQSLSDGLDIAAQPIPFSTVGIDLANDVIYSIFPNSTNTAVARQFLPSDLNADPRIVHADKVKTQATVSTSEDTPLKLQTLEFDIGPEEANKALMVIQYLGRRISAATGASYGSVTVEAVVDADTTFASPDVTKEFTSAFEEYNVPSAGVAFRTLMLQISGEHDPGTTESPDGLPVIITTVQDWPQERTYVLQITELVSPNNIFDFMDTMESLATSTKIVLPLDMSTVSNQPAKFDRWLIPTEGLMLPPRSVQPAPGHFVDAQGNEVFMGIQFHTVPGTGV